MRPVDRLTSPLFVALAVFGCSGKSTGAGDDAATTGATNTQHGNTASTASADETSTPTETTQLTHDVQDAGSDTHRRDASVAPDLADAGSGEDVDASPSDEAAPDASDAGANDDAGVRTFRNQCVAEPLRCGDHLQHITTELGVSIWDGYVSTQRVISGKEVLYSLDAKSGCDVSVVLSDANVDLDLYRLTSCVFVDSSTFDLVDSVEGSITPLPSQTIEQLEFTIEPGDDTFIVVDGVEGAEGSYSLDVECSCP